METKSCGAGLLLQSQGIQYLNDNLNEPAHVLVKLFHKVKKLKICPQQKCPQHPYNSIR